MRVVPRARSSTPAKAARLVESPGGGPVLPRSATIRPNLDRPRCALSYPLSSLDFSEWLLLTLGRCWRHLDRCPPGISSAIRTVSLSGVTVVCGGDKDYGT